MGAHPFVVGEAVEAAHQLRFSKKILQDGCAGQACGTRQQKLQITCVCFCVYFDFRNKLFCYLSPPVSVSGQTRGDQIGRAVGCDMTLSGEKLGESLEGVLPHQSIVERKVWTSPLALENHASNRLVEIAARFGCLNALADRKKEALNDLSKIDHRLLVSKTLQESVHRYHESARRSRSLELPQGFPSWILR
jgi:hypothetical protein